MSSVRSTSARAFAAFAALAIASVGVVAGASSSTADEPANPLPVFEFESIITDKDEMIYNPNDEFIFPSMFHAGEHLENPLGEWYLYYAPHDPPGGISFLYSDSLDGPWTEYQSNPIITINWAPYYDYRTVDHVSSPEAIWNEQEQRVFLYYHGDNSITRYATSDDGVTFDYGGTAVTNAMGGASTTESSYARVFEHPDANSQYDFAMLYMSNSTDNIRSIRLAESVDGRTWVVWPGPIVVPRAIEGQNVSGANLWEWEGQLYVIYHSSSGVIWARPTNAALTQFGDALELHRTRGIGDDAGRAAAPDIVTDSTGTYLFYEAGDRLGATIAYAKLNPDAVRGLDPDPLRELCQGAGSDEFAAGPLNRSTWPTIVRESAAVHSFSAGDLVLPTVNAGVAGAPLIVQPVPSGGWEVTTEVTLDPSAKFQQAGILLYRNDTNYAKVDLTFGSAGQRFEYIWRVNGVDHNTAAQSIPPPAGSDETFWLRLASNGSVVTAWLSVNGETFTQVGGTVPISTLAPTAIGPYAIKGAGAAPVISARFGWWRWTPNAAEREACA